MAKATPKSKAKAPAKLGRPTAYGEKIVAKILELALDGKTDLEISKKTGIAVSTLNNWKNEHPDFLEALKAAKDVSDDEVEAALRSRAIGHRHEAVKFFWDQKRGVVVSQRYTEIYPPDTGAASLWLKNRRPDKWRDIHSLEHTGRDGKPIATHQVTAIEITKAAQEAVANAGEPSEDY